MPQTTFNFSPELVCGRLSHLSPRGLLFLLRKPVENVELVRDYLISLPSARIVRDEISNIFTRRFEVLWLLDSMKHPLGQISLKLHSSFVQLQQQSEVPGLPQHDHAR